MNTDNKGTTAPGRFSWIFNPKLVTVAVVSTAVVVLAGLVQVSFGAFSMTVMEGWRAVFNPDVILNRQAWKRLLPTAANSQR